MDSLKTKQKAREDRIGKAGEETERSKRIQENLGKWWAQKERSPAWEASDLNGQPVDGEPVDEDIQILSARLSSATQSLVHVESSVSVCGQTLATTASSRPSQRRTRQQPLPPQPLADIAAGINGIVAELKADREAVAQGAREEELLRLDAEVKELCESIEARLAATD